MATHSSSLSFGDISFNRLPNDSITTLALVLGDQLNAGHSWFKTIDRNRLFVLMEVREETDYAKHHIQKIVGFFAAMRHFAQALSAAGHHVCYLSLDDPNNRQSVTKNLSALLQRLPRTRQVQLQQPDEYRVDEYLQAWAGQQSVEVQWYDSEHFLTQRSVLNDWFPGKENFLMESFYRRVRQQTGYLMENDKPIGGKWNFDKDNRNKLPNQQDVAKPLLFSHNVSDIIAMLKKAGVETIGDIEPQRFIWPTSRLESRQLLDFFVENLLENFGRYQDAMHTEYWSLFHARLSFSLNTKMLSPREVVEKAISYWQNNSSRINIAQIEGFVRQIIGWREFIRAIYWHHMPYYSTTNFFENKAPLPSYYWTGKTHMLCMAKSIQQSLEFSYAHHIQRLMITGNFALLANVNPDEVDAWYLGIYIDALQWVELPNTRGMSQFADGGVLATKPYVSSGSYINKMSNYCQHCHYDVNQRVGTNSCPFNSLYWHFIDSHYEQLSKNARMGLILSQWDKRDKTDKQELLEQARLYLNQIDSL
ncbi:cryptochrome/photolyase family protein [Pseudidiomarina marina]|uniref:cryptochrome/photolyase family protein n=1 Tax=Pseudidiomarina marina TaxID=502366 RepID=UPI00384BF2EC